MRIKKICTRRIKSQKIADSQVGERQGNFNELIRKDLQSWSRDVISPKGRTLTYKTTVCNNIRKN